MAIRKRLSKKAKNGYTYQVYFYYNDLFGIQRYYSKSGFKTKSEAQMHEALKKSELKENGSIMQITNKTFNDVYSEFIENESDLFSINTINSRKSIFNKHLKNHDIGKSKITYFSDFKFLQNYFNSLKQQNKTLNIAIKKVINNVTEYAIKMGYIKSCPIDLINIKGIENTPTEKKIVPYDLFSKAYNELDYYYSITIAIGYYTGMRLSEVLGLTRDDINFKENYININKQLIYVGRKTDNYEISNVLKSSASKTKIPLGNILKDILLEHIKKYPYDFLCMKNGKFYDVSYFQKKLKKKYGFTFHELRHTFTTNLINKGIDIKTVQELLRHTNFNTTLSIYTHVKSDKKLNAINDTFKTKNVKNMSNSNNLPN